MLSWTLAIVGLIQTVSSREGVNCGAHRAATCSQCPKGHGRHWCNGECVWHMGGKKCMTKQEHARLTDATPTKNEPRGTGKVLVDVKCRSHYDDVKLKRSSDKKSSFGALLSQTMVLVSARNFMLLALESSRCEAFVEKMNHFTRAMQMRRRAIANFDPLFGLGSSLSALELPQFPFPQLW